MTLTFQTRSERPARCVAVIDSVLPLVFVMTNEKGQQFSLDYREDGRASRHRESPGDILGLTPEIVAGIKAHFNRTNL